MGRCGFCGTFVIFGGVKDMGEQFCGEECHHKARGHVAASGIPEEIIEQAIVQAHQGPCPRCQGPGPIDVHTSYRIMSFGVFSTWRSTPEASCRRCGVKRQLGNTALSFVMGWWGFPWGLFMTPIQISRNIGGMVRGPDASRPSEQMRQMVTLGLAEQHLLEHRPD